MRRATWDDIASARSVTRGAGDVPLVVESLSVKKAAARVMVVYRSVRAVGSGSSARRYARVEMPIANRWDIPEGPIRDLVVSGSSSADGREIVSSRFLDSQRSTRREDHQRIADQIRQSPALLA